VVCPLLRNNTVNTTGLSGDAWLFATSANVNGDQLERDFVVTHLETGQTAFVSPIVQVNFGVDRIELPMHQSVPLGSYLIRCILPPQSSMNAYATPEF
jgi:hypothetical protein